LHVVDVYRIISCGCYTVKRSDSSFQN